MNVLVLGGSNSRMQMGYVKRFREEMEAAHPQPGVFDNLALGANTCLLGLVTLSEHPAQQRYDLVVIEYSVNDYAMMASGDLDLWQASYEGLIRMVARRWPAAKICCVLLGRSNVDPALWARQIEETHRIAAHYSMVVVADVQAYLSSLRMAQEDLYADPMHYTPRAQELAGRLIARLAEGFVQPPASALPPSLHEQALDQVGVIDFAAFGPPRIREFSNSVVRIRAMELHMGERFELEIPGPPVCVVFVSTSGCGSFVIGSEGERALIHTLHDGVRDGKFAFLPLSAYGKWWRHPVTHHGLSFEPVPHVDRPADWPTFHVVPSTAEKPVVYLSKLLFRVSEGPGSATAQPRPGQRG